MLPPHVVPPGWRNIVGSFAEIVSTQMPLSWKGPEGTTKLVVWTMGQGSFAFKMLLEDSNVCPWFAASSVSRLFCTLTLLFFSPTAFLSTCAKLAAVFSMSSLKFISRVFSGSPLWLLLHDPYRRLMWQERKRLNRVKEQGLSQQRVVIQKASGGRWLASHGSQSGMLSRGESSGDGCLQRLHQGWPWSRAEAVA